MLIQRPATIQTPSAEPVDYEALFFTSRLQAELKKIASELDGGDAMRPVLLAAMRQTMTEARTLIRQRFEANGSGEDCVRAQCALADLVVGSLADFTVTHVYPNPGPAAAEQFDIAATGGYGRGELAPFSDIDLLFLLPAKRTGRIEQVVEYMLYILWDLGIKVGHAVRSEEECLRMAKGDITIRTNLLESRLLWGSGKLLAGFRKRFVKEILSVDGQAYVVAKLAERDQRHHKMGDSRYVLEPNIKEGKGGLRDLQTLFWIAKSLYQVEEVHELVTRGVLLRDEALRFAKVRNFLWTVRCHLHYVTNRAEERLTFDVQNEIGRRLGYTDHIGAAGVERFMKHYFLVVKDVGDLTRIFCSALESDAIRPPRFNLLRFTLARKKEIEGFRLDRERLNLRHDRQFREEPIDMIRLFHVSHTNGIDIHPNALRALTRALGGIRRLTHDEEANRLCLDILTSREDPEVTLRRMSEAGVLGRFLSDFGRVIAQMQYDMYHAYTVDEHTLFAIGILHKLESGQLKEEVPLASRVFHTIASRRALYVAMLLHDIAKGRGGDHSVLGAKVAEKLCPRLGLTEEETETVSWLVLNHLSMTQIAFKRDLDDDRTVRDFVELVQSPERLRLLLVLTTADIRAVGPGRWNNWKGTLLGELYERAEERMSGANSVDARERRIGLAQAALRTQLTDWTEADIAKFISLGYPAYWLSFEAQTHAHHARLIREADRDQAPLTVNWRIDSARAVTEITIYTGDHPGLFAQLAGGLSVAGANIVDARIYTMTNGKALDVFTVQDAQVGGAMESGDKLARLSVMIDKILSGQVKLLQELEKRRKSQPGRARLFKVPPRVIIDNDASSTHTVVEVNGRDRVGLLYEVTRTLTRLSLQISSAKVSTYGAKAIDVFYIKDIFGLKISHEAKLSEIRRRLLDALGDPVGGAAPTLAGNSEGVAMPLPERKRARRSPAPRRTKKGAAEE
ncbi:(Protein-PII) uridylyltransferase / (Protein-PII)-UMP uridylyl-removing enzyme [uncultured Gammaproteobacteria bacterium]